MSYLSAEKAESELQQSIKKAVSTEETAPKQKHVRKCVVYTWDHHSSAVIWNILKVQPVLSSEVQTFKTLILVHKVIKDGHREVLNDARKQTGWLESAARSVSGNGVHGYGNLIREYTNLLLHKIDFHSRHPEFNGTFDYQEYITLKNMDDPNEGYGVIDNLARYQDQIDRFQKKVFGSFDTRTNNECRIASLVPLVEESYGIYQFMISMLRALHKKTDEDALKSLRDNFNKVHETLLTFYKNCANLRYLTSLIKLPELSQNPPDVTDQSTPKLPKRPAIEAPPATPPAPSPEPVIDFWSEQQQREYQDQQRRLEQQWADEQERIRQQQQQQQREYEEQQRLMAERERMQQEELLRQQMHSQQAGRINDLEMQILNYRNQLERDQMLLEQYDRRVKALEQEMAHLNSNAQQRDASKDELIRSLQNEIQMWKSKYEALAKLYSQLRKEHLELLNKHKQLQAKANTVDEIEEKLERMQADMRAKNTELADLIRERDRARNELARLQGNQKDDLERLRRELDESRDKVNSLNRSKGDEVSSLLARFNREKAELEASLAEKQALIDEFLNQLEGKESDAERIRREKDEEIAVLQAGMDECFAQLKEKDDEVDRIRQEKDEEIQVLEESMSQLAEMSLESGGADLKKLGEDKIGDIVAQEMSSATNAIQDAKARLEELMNRPINPTISELEMKVHQIILAAVLALTNAVAGLIKCATNLQNEIVAQGRGTSPTAEFYKKNNRWTEGLISAAWKVAVTTNVLVETADGVISRTHTLTQLIVASEDVSGATVQLVSAARVKSSFMSPTKQKLEDASTVVKDAANDLVKQVKVIVGEKATNDDNVDYNKMSVHEFKKREMEQRVKIHHLDVELTNARRVLAKMRQSGYHTDETD